VRLMTYLQFGGQARTLGSLRKGANHVSNKIDHAFCGLQLIAI